MVILSGSVFWPKFGAIFTANFLEHIYCTVKIDEENFSNRFFSAFFPWNNALLCSLWLAGWLAGSLRSRKLQRFKDWDLF